MKDKKYLFLIVFAALSFLFLGYPSNLSRRVDDFAKRVFYALQKGSFDSSDIVVVEIDEVSLEKIDSQWPFKRTIHAQALDNIQKHKPKVVGFDIVFAGRSTPEADQIFAQSLKNAESPVVMAYFIDWEGSAVYPSQEIKDSASLGFVNVVADRDQVVRQARGYFQQDDFSDFSWSAKIAAYFSGGSLEKEEGGIRVDEAYLSVDPQGVFLINYLLKPDDFKSISFYELLSEDSNLDILSGKIVLISSVLAITHDIHPTPLAIMPGVYIHANVIFDILNNRLIDRLPLIFNFIVLAAAFLVIGYFFSSYTFLRSVFLSLGVLLFLFWLDYGLRIAGLQLAYGKIVVASLAFITLTILYSYVKFLMTVARIKTHAVANPLTGLCNVRYFFERLSFDLKKIPKTTVYIIIIRLRDFPGATANLDFSEIKNFWKEITPILFSCSKLWCNYSQETILGEIKDSKKASGLREEIQNLILQFDVELTVKAAVLKAEDKILQKSVISDLIKKMDKSKEDIITFDRNDFIDTSARKIEVSDFLSALYSDTEEKNRDLLLSIKKLKKEEDKTKKAYLQLIYSLVAALESKDPYTQGHTDRVCKYSLMLANELKLSSDEKEKIRKAALLHDLGKIGISDFVLHKKGKLTDAEFEKIKEHQTISARILKPIDEFKDIIPYILYHHEDFDGTGYPHGLAGNFIPLGARIIAVADVFDALITGRDYKEAFSPEKTVAILNDMKNKRLDPELVDIFIQVLKDNHII